MIALPSIAFGGFSGSAKGVTARQVGGRSILSLKCFSTGLATSAQVARRTSMSKITKSWKNLTEAQMLGWDHLAEHTSGKSVFGQAAQISGLNLYIRLNISRTMAGESILYDAPEQLVCLPNVAYDKLWVTTKNIVIKGITHETGYKLVIKMSAGQSAGVSHAWSKTVILSPGMEDDWGDADMTYLYFKTIGVKPAVGEKVFLEMYWLDPATGFTGQTTYDSKVCVTEAEAEAEGYVKRNKITMDDLTEESSVSECDIDFSTGAPVISFDAICLGQGGVASSYAYPKDAIPNDCVGTSMALGRGMGTGEGALAAQSYIIWLRNSSSGESYIGFAHRGGYYVKPTEVFGAGSIQFKDYQAENYVVLSAKFSYAPTNAAYQAADVLEIYVPDLSIGRSAVAGVILTFQDRYVYPSYTWNNDGGTAIKSWIKDKNTICLEKFTHFDDKGEITIYLQALYPMLNQGGSPIKGTRTRLNMTQETRYLYWDSDTFCVIFEHWVSLHMQLSSCSYAYEKQPREATMENFPTDVTADPPFLGGSNQFNPSVDGYSLAHVENGLFTCPERMNGFGSTGHEAFIFAFLVRDQA